MYSGTGGIMHSYHYGCLVKDYIDDIIILVEFVIAFSSPVVDDDTIITLSIRIVVDILLSHIEFDLFIHCLSLS
jgi:hypothetical protein